MEPEPNVIEAHPGTDGTAPVPFFDARPVGDGRRIEIRFTGGLRPCFVLDRIDVVERPDTVNVTLYAGHDPAVRHAVCSRARLMLRAFVDLQAPLGDRSVRDGSVH